MRGASFTDILIQVAVIIAAVMLCMIVHELCHGLAAYALGDPTAKTSGRLSFNPVRHIDPIGALMLLFVGFGWAKPVQVDPRYFDNPKRDMALTALAGPFSNFLMAFLAMGIWVHTAVWSLLRGGTPGYALYSFLEAVIYLNIGLGVFNLIPFPPLDGSKVLGAFLSDRAYWALMRYERYGMIVLIVLSMTGSLGGFLQNFVTGIAKAMQSVWI
jgi:Zn-dependent protease